MEKLAAELHIPGLSERSLRTRQNIDTPDLSSVATVNCVSTKVVE
jgi:hypothetical protein